jgi:hypothetical protein
VVWYTDSLQFFQVSKDCPPTCSKHLCQIANSAAFSCLQRCQNLHDSGNSVVCHGWSSDFLQILVNQGLVKKQHQIFGDKVSSNVSPVSVVD